MSEEKGTSAEQFISKKQMKKLMKREKWIATKDVRKTRQKEKRKRRILEAREKEESGVVVPRKQIKLMKDSACQIRVAIDLSQDHLMTDLELSKAIKQLQRCYSLNRRSLLPLQLYFTSFKSAVKTRLHAVQPGCKNWDIHFREEHYIEEFGVENVVYLTSDSPNVLNQLEISKAYIIGGLVDHNRHKGLCYKLAEEKGIEHAQLPIDDCLIMKTRKVLTIDQVFNILLRVADETTWKDAFLSVLPQRKGATLRDNNNVSDEEMQEKIFLEDMDNKSCEEIIEKVGLETDSGDVLKDGSETPLKEQAS